MKRVNGRTRWAALAIVVVALGRMRGEVIETEVCVFGGTSGGVAAAVQAARMGHSAVVAEPSRRVGGMSSGGLGATDIGNKAAIGGIAREFYRRLGAHYGEPESWTFEPHVAEELFRDLARQAGVRLVLGQRLASVRKVEGWVREIQMEDGTVYRAQMFIDATYEGDLLAKAGVSYAVGRESNGQYGERLNGVRAKTPSHQFVVPVDPYVRPGEPDSGLLPFIQAGDGGEPGSGDRSVQAYNYRLCFTTNAANRLPILAPEHYDPARFELLARYLEALVAAGRRPTLADFWHPIWMPNQKTDINNNGGFSTDFIGANYTYPEADYQTRARIEQEHLDYTRGFLTFLATSPRVPENIREEMKVWGPCRDEFVETGGWSPQIYVREGRRMVGAYVMTEHNCRGAVVAADPIGLGAYNMDSHNCQRIVRAGRVENEGDVQVPVKPYPISFRAIVPKEAECRNLLAPVCLSATHIAFGSIRMEPVFMILGQSAATAACLAIKAGGSVQSVEYPMLRARLVADGQVLAWMDKRVEWIDGKKLGGIVLDDSQAERRGEWVPSASAEARRVGDGYVHDNNAHKGELEVIYRPELPRSSYWEVTLISVPHPNRARQVPVTIAVDGKLLKSVRVNQRDGNGYDVLGLLELPKGKHATVTVSNAGTDGYVVADGIRFREVAK